ncbi:MULTISPECIES: hypothetical protein [Mesorhizobium]|uniref:Uncharacterized protein n=1 Tax=Mesorhizobium denitrificans TaxID=2294114 RepID=A0A371X8R7_9HYPH|nr:MULTISPECIES: hypothetical protein [Mesorhizobium]RFC65629.1 hypothetical protein DY251_17800 [Mesorhizobium denitrificans]
MIEKRLLKGAMSEETKPMRDTSMAKPAPHADDEINASFRKIRSDLRVVLWMMGASLVMSIILFIGVFFMGIRL